MKTYKLLENSIGGLHSVSGLRQSGKTTRLIEWAEQMAAEHDGNIYILSPTRTMSKHIKRELFLRGVYNTQVIAPYESYGWGSSATTNTYAIIDQLDYFGDPDAAVDKVIRLMPNEVMYTTDV